MRSPIAAAPAQQKDNLCGPFWVARILRDAGFEEWGGEPVDQDLVALHAGTTLPASSEGPSVPRGAAGWTEYRHPLPVAPAEESGTSAAGLVGVVEAASAGALRCVPIRGAWTAERVVKLVDEAQRLGARLVANVRTGKLWGSHPSIEAVLAEAAGSQVEGPAPDWDVGHFIELATVLRPSELIVVRDSYPTLGWEGNHLQPARAVASALLRGDGREGGVLAIVAREKADQVSAVAREIGLGVGLWNNGSRSEGNGDR